MASMCGKKKMLSLFVIGTVMLLPGPPTFLVPGMIAAPPPTAARTGAPTGPVIDVAVL